MFLNRTDLLSLFGFLLLFLLAKSESLILEIHILNVIILHY